jgi:hypothetical protein
LINVFRSPLWSCMVQYPQTKKIVWFNVTESITSIKEQILGKRKNVYTRSPLLVIIRRSNTSKYCRNWGSKVNSPSWEVPYPASWNIDWILARAMISKYLHNDIRTADKPDGPKLSSSTVIKENNIHLINLKICPIKWEASSHCCSAWYLLTFDQRKLFGLAIYNTQDPKLKGPKKTCQKCSSDFLSLHFSYTVATKACWTST